MLSALAAEEDKWLRAAKATKYQSECIWNQPWRGVVWAIFQEILKSELQQFSMRKPLSRTIERKVYGPQSQSNVHAIERCPSRYRSYKSNGF